MKFPGDPDTENIRLYTSSGLHKEDGARGERENEDGCVWERESESDGEAGQRSLCWWGGGLFRGPTQTSDRWEA